jgi:hypothetical protein
MRRVPNVVKGAMNAQIVRNRKDHSCLFCGKGLRKGIRSRTYYINGLGREHFCMTHNRDEVVIAILDLFP